MRIRIAIIAAVTALVSVGAASAFSSATTPTLKGTVGPGFTISLRDSKGKLVKTLKAGTYKFYCSVPGHRQAGMEGTLTVQ